MKLKLTALALVASMLVAPAFAGGNDYDPTVLGSVGSGTVDMSVIQTEVDAAMADADIAAGTAYYNQQVGYVAQVGGGNGNYAVIDQTTDGSGGNFAAIMQDSTGIANVAVISQANGLNHASINQR